MATFRRSKKIGGIKLNFSKSGIGVSTGIKGLRVGIDSKGKAYRSVGIPGTGIYSRKNLTTSSKSNNYSENYDSDLVDLLGFDYPTDLYRESDGKGCLKTLVWIISIVLIPAGIGIFTTIGLIIYTYTQKKKPKNVFKKNFVNAVINARTGKFENAIQNLNIAENIEPNNKYLIDLKGVCFYIIGEYEKAKEYFEKLAEIERTERIDILLSETYRKIDNPDYYEKIVELNKEYLKYNPTDTETNFLTGYYLYRIGKYDEAISFLQKINEDDGLYLQSLNAIAICFYELKEFDSAIQVLQKAPLRKQRLDDDLKSIHYLLGCIYQEIKDEKNALKHFKKVMIDDLNYKDIKERINELNN